MKFIVLALALLVSGHASADALVIPAGQKFACSPTHVWDGDGPIWCEEGPKVRISGVNARETDNTCNISHPCPSKEAKWDIARDFLVNLIGIPTGTKSQHGHIIVRGPTMECLSVGGAGRDRTAAWCISPRSGDISCELIKSGLAAKWPKYWKGHACDDD